MLESHIHSVCVCVCVCVCVSLTSSSSSLTRGWYDLVSSSSAVLISGGVLLAWRGVLISDGVLLTWYPSLAIELKAYLILIIKCVMLRRK